VYLGTEKATPCWIDTSSEKTLQVWNPALLTTLLNFDRGMGFVIRVTTPPEKGNGKRSRQIPALLTFKGAER